MSRLKDKGRGRRREAKERTAATEGGRVAPAHGSCSGSGSAVVVVAAPDWRRRRSGSAVVVVSARRRRRSGSAVVVVSARRRRRSGSFCTPGSGVVVVATLRRARTGSAVVVDTAPPRIKSTPAGSGRASDDGAARQSTATRSRFFDTAIAATRVSCGPVGSGFWRFGARPRQQRQS